MINQRLFNWYGIDTNKNLGLNTFCPRPFDTLLIDKQGNCYLCECTSWLPQSAGNLHLQSLKEVINCKVAKELQNSILDRSYRYCNNKQCAWLLDKNNPPNWSTEFPKNKIKNIRLAIDDSCNLSCPSCRTRQLFEKDKSRLKNKYGLADKIIEFIRSQEHTVNVHVGSDGDPFASLVYRYFIKNIENCANVRFTIQTNGLLISKMHKRFSYIFDRLDSLNISIDGATQQTYEKLRRGGSFQQIIENLEYVKNLKNSLNFKLIIHYVVQKHNYKEMPLMVELSKKYRADHIWFNRITNWNTFKNFNEEDVCNNQHQEYFIYLKIVENMKQSMDFKKKYVEMATL